MKHVFTKILLSFAWLLLGACSSHFDPSSDGSYQVRIPLDDGQNHFSLQTVQLKTITDINSLSDQVSEIKMSGTVRSFVDSKGNGYTQFQNLGSTPNAHFVKDGEVLHPADFKTLMMATATYHFEKIKEFFDQEDMNEGLLFPRAILLDVNTVTRVGGQNKAEVDNAGYMSGVDLFLVQPYRSDDLPIAMNGGLLSHEYAHSVFQQKMQEASVAAHANLDTWTEHNYENETSDTPIFTPTKKGIIFNLDVKATQKINDYVFSTFNEGLADFFGYLYSHNPNFGEASLRSAGSRSLSFHKYSIVPSSLETQKLFLYENVLVPPGGKTLDPHIGGAAFAHLLYRVSQEWGEVEMRKQSLEFMKNYAALYMGQYKERFIPLFEVVNLFFKNHPASGKVCDALKSVYPEDSDKQTISCAATVAPTVTP